MKIACIIDSLGSGGAQRQLTELSVGLKEKGHEVSVCYYHSDKTTNSFFQHVMDNNGINLVRMELKNVVSKVTQIRKWLMSYKPEIVQAYLSGPNAVATITGIGQYDWKVIVSERSMNDYTQSGNLRLKVIAQLYRMADWVVSNSYSNHVVLVKHLPFLEGKSCVIWNCVDLEKFIAVRSPRINGAFHFICVASMGSVKNAPRIIRALGLLKKNAKRRFDFRWIGNYNRDIKDHRRTMQETLESVEALGLQDVFSFVGEIGNVEDEYRKADALVLVSLNEGLPNTVCEGMACGLPIVASNISDIPKMVYENVNGFLCDPMDVFSIANAMERCLELSDSELSQFGNASRRMAERMFSKDMFVGRYENLYYDLTK